MISALFAALLLTAAQNQTATPDPWPAAYEDDYTDVQDAGGPAEAGEYAEPEAVLEDVSVQDAAPEEPEEEVPMVCRRVHYQDDYGRQRSRRSCTPR